MNNQVWVNAQMPEELKKKLEEMAKDDERSASAMIRILISNEWEKRNSDCIICSQSTSTN